MTANLPLEIINTETPKARSRCISFVLTIEHRAQGCKLLSGLVLITQRVEKGFKVYACMSCMVVRLLPIDGL